MKNVANTNIKNTCELSKELSNLNPNDENYSQKRMKLMVAYLKRYIETYDKQYHYENYTDTTLIDDILYGLGVALNPDEHSFADGFYTWKKKLYTHLEKDKKYWNE